MELHPQRPYLRHDDRKARRAYARRSRVRFSRLQALGVALIFFGIVGVVGAVQEAHGGNAALLVAVLALGGAFLVPIPTIPGDWRDDD